MSDVEKMATTVLGSGKEQFYPALLHLVVADSAYCDANKDTGGVQVVEGMCVHTLEHASAVCVYVHCTVAMFVHDTCMQHSTHTTYLGHTCSVSCRKTTHTTYQLHAWSSMCSECTSL